MAIKAADQVSIVDITDAYSIILTSEAVTFVATSDTALGTQRTATTTVVAYRGDTPLVPTIGTITAPTGITVSKGTATTAGCELTITAASTLAAGGEISIPVTVDGDVTITKKFSYAVAFKGTTGGTGTAAYNYNLTASAGSIVKAESGSMTPASITFTATRAQGTGNPAAYSGRFKIEYSADGTSWTSAYTSSTNESSKAYTINSTTLASAQFLRCTLYLAGGTTTVLQILTIPIVSDGVTGGTGAAGKGVSAITGHYLATSASSGVTTSTSGWTTSVQTMTSTNKYLWYYETITYVNPSSTSNTTPCIIGTYGEKGETGDTGPQGPTGPAGDDAITLVITSSAGTIFKNSDIATTLTAHVYMGGIELSASTSPTLASVGTIKWYKDGASTAAATGQTLTISAGDVSNKVTYIAQLEA